MSENLTLTKTTIALHWLVGLTVITMITVGIYMSEYEVWDLYPIHKSIGIIIFVFILYRFIRRMKRGWPQPVSQYQKHEIILSKIIHWVLIIGTLMFPISGMMMSGAGGHGLSVFGLELLASSYTASGEAIALNSTLADLGHEVHELLVYVMIGAIVLHIAGALKHHLIDKDNTLKRMLGK
ncbi:MAG: cytochrome b [Proteobacteria bacterium]|nr:cytochrome b [Pseudomonadota bacterium]